MRKDSQINRSEKFESEEKLATCKRNKRNFHQVSQHRKLVSSDLVFRDVRNDTFEERSFVQEGFISNLNGAASCRSSVWCKFYSADSCFD